MTNDQLKPIIDEILSYYFNQNTRLQYSTKIQKEMINQNRGLINACNAIVGFCNDKDGLVEYIKTKIDEINKGEVQEVNIP